MKRSSDVMVSFCLLTGGLLLYLSQKKFGCVVLISEGWYLSLSELHPRSAASVLSVKKWKMVG